MQCMLLIYHDEDMWTRLGGAERDAIYADYRALAEEMGKAGMMRAGGELMPSETATTLRTRDGKTVSLAGPSAQSGEQLAGFFLVECPTLDDAFAWAAKIPTVKIGSIEVRQVAV